MPELSVQQSLDETDLGNILELLEAADHADGFPGLSDQQRIELTDSVHRGDSAHRGDFLAVLLRITDDDPLVAYGQLSPVSDGWEMSVVVHPDHRMPVTFGDQDSTTRSPADPSNLAVSGAGSVHDLPADRILEALVASAHVLGATHVRLWVRDVRAQDDLQAARHGLSPERDLYQLRCPLPLIASVARSSAPVPVRTFVPGIDEKAWLIANNRAFAGHLEQGGWDLETLLARQREPWFDPAGFLVYDPDGPVAAWCWTKVHADHDPPLGEIYVIGVDPDYQGKGLGRVLTQSGLDHLSSLGLTEGMLYVDADNTAARSLYAAMGFTLHHIDRAYGTVLGAG